MESLCRWRTTDLNALNEVGRTWALFSYAHEIDVISVHMHYRLNDEGSNIPVFIIAPLLTDISLGKLKAKEYRRLEGAKIAGSNWFEQNFQNITDWMLAVEWAA